jgi:hypothetical protein
MSSNGNTQASAVAKVNAELNAVERLIGEAEAQKPFERVDTQTLQLDESCNHAAMTIIHDMQRFNEYANDWANLTKQRKTMRAISSIDSVLTTALTRGLELLKNQYERSANVLGNECYAVATARATQDLIRGVLKADEFSKKIETLQRHYQINP